MVCSIRKSAVITVNPMHLIGYWQRIVKSSNWSAMRGESKMLAKHGLLVVWLLAIMLAGCAHAPDSDPNDPAAESVPAGHTASLYDRLGGKTAITAVIDDLMLRIEADPRISEFFAESDIPEVKSLLVDQLCELSGGPCRYEGRDMVAAHVGMGVSQADFDAMVDDLVQTLKAFDVPAP